MAEMLECTDLVHCHIATQFVHFAIYSALLQMLHLVNKLLCYNQEIKKKSCRNQEIKQKNYTDFEISYAFWLVSGPLANALISEAHFTLTMAVNGRICVPTGKILDSSMAVSKGASPNYSLYT